MASIQKKVRVRAELNGVEFATKMGLEPGTLEINRPVQLADGSWTTERVTLDLTIGANYVLVYEESFTP